MKLFNILSKLLDYPNAELLENLDAVLEVVNTSADINAEEKLILSEFVAWLRLHKSITALQQQYVQTFDMVAEHDLHVTHHLFGEEKTRGPALIDLSELYRQEGLELAQGEIPDYIPLMLEYVSLLDDMQSRVFLGEIFKVLVILGDNLEQARSPYAPLIRLLEQRGNLTKAA